MRLTLMRFMLLAVVAMTALMIGRGFNLAETRQIGSFTNLSTYSTNCYPQFQSPPMDDFEFVFGELDPVHSMSAPWAFMARIPYLLPLALCLSIVPAYQRRRESRRYRNGL